MRIVHEILRSKGHAVWSIRPDATVYEALALLAEADIGALMVVDGEEVVGVFSERDYARKVILLGGSSREMPVSRIMSRNIVAVTETHSIDDCMRLMTDHRARHLPVLEDGRLVGVVSIGDVVKARIREQGMVIEQLEDYIRAGGV